MSKQEKIVCAAVKFTDNGGRSDISSIAMCVYYSDEKLNDVRSDNLAYGIIATETNGFITNKNRFVDAKEAQKIAIESGQFIHPVDRIKSLEKGIEWLKAIESDPKSNKENVIAAIDKAKQEIADLQNGYRGDSLSPEDLY